MSHPNLFTEVIPKKTTYSLSPAQSFITLGSCFAERLGERFQKSGLQCTPNPLGVAYNPLSLLRQFQLLNGSSQLNFAPVRATSDSQEAPGLDFHFHSSFQAKSADALQTKLSAITQEQSEVFKKASCIIITLGTSFGYFHPDHGLINNCHKQPGTLFERKKLELSEMVEAWKTELTSFFQNSDQRVIFSVSPIRHLRDDAAENSLSKAQLRILCAELESSFEQVLYFPSYEIMMDELRDYRFYEENLTHPSRIAVDLILARFFEWIGDAALKEYLMEAETCRKFDQHIPKVPTRENLDAHQAQAAEKWVQLKRKFGL